MKERVGTARRRKKQPLLKRAAWHALKALVRNHPGAALSAAGAGAGYAVSHGVREGAQALGEGLREGVRKVGAALTPRDDADAKVIEGKAVEVREVPRLTGPRRR